MEPSVMKSVQVQDRVVGRMDPCIACGGKMNPTFTNNVQNDPADHLLLWCPHCGSIRQHCESYEEGVTGKVHFGSPQLLRIMPGTRPMKEQRETMIEKLFSDIELESETPENQGETETGCDKIEESAGKSAAAG